MPEEERLEKFREVRDQIEAKIHRWLEHPEEEIQKLKEEQERERQKRLTAARREAGRRNAFATPEPGLAGVTSASGVLESELGSVSLT